MSYAYLSDDELARMIAAADERAHAPNAPGINEFNLHADGIREIRNHSNYYARAAQEWFDLCAGRNKRVGSSGEPAVLKPLIPRVEGDPASDPGLSAGSPLPPLHVIVPREPTEAMIRASKGALYRHIVSLPDSERNRFGDHGYRVPQRQKTILRWRAMVEAHEAAALNELSHDRL